MSRIPADVAGRPLVVTATVDADTQEYWDWLRRTWFPPDRLQVGAHITLFHALPGEHLDSVGADCAVLAGETSRFTLAVTGVRSLGRGVALALDSPELVSVHSVLRSRWLRWLTPQDRQPLKPHVTVQNKVGAATAAATLATLRQEITPSTARVTGLAVWRYLGGPWEPISRHEFSGTVPV
ncbi:2'-5' RNA ligase family protein [Amycolatopsis oliviviridis]|uniref:2'-5' RNA ligase family protein n=1 Tax=Amycolatopsis oliviviridis TaxID=1471590 RepID=UPI001E5CD7DE|nr:2'-5' RNA ligase family protein [Amycolatopsis oliviviridis]